MSAPSSQHDQQPPQWWVQLCRWGWKFLSFVLGTLLLGLLANWLFSAQNVNINTLKIGALLDWLNQHSFLMTLISVALVVLIGITWYGSRQGQAVTANRHPATAPSEHNRTALIRLLNNDYRRQLTQSLQGAAMMQLGLQERTDLISSPAQFVSWRIDAPEKPSLPTHISIIEAYDEASAGLLILGAPGAGKSTLLRELANELITRAKQDPTHPIPVIVNLSSWATKKQPLATWLVEQLQLVYAIPRHLSQAWIEQNQFLLLLDGLDEVEVSVRPMCIEYINAYRAEHFIPLVVCSRSHEYQAQEQRLTLPYAVEVQPIDSEQVDDYLKQVGRSLAAVRTALRSNVVLRELVTTPLMLSMVMLTYRGKTAKDLPHLGTTEEQQREVFEHYVTRMLEQPARKWSYTLQQTRRGLIWLAQQMKQHQFTDFYLERLQPSWLPTKRLQILYPWFIGLVVELVVWLLFGLVGGLLFGLFSGLVAGLVAGLVIGLVVGLITGLLSTYIQPTEMLSWSWSKFPQALVIGLFGGLLVGLLSGLFTKLFGGLLSGTALGLFSGSVFGLLIWLVVMFSGTQLDEHTRLKPNQGIQSSGKNAFRMGLVFGLLAGLFEGLFYGPLVGLFGGLLRGLGLGLIVGLSGGLFFGGVAYLNHYMLRFLLWQSKVMPWHSVRFLNEATERILLQPVGGGYRFIHPLLQDYFASLKTTSSSISETEHEPQAPASPEVI